MGIRENQRVKILNYLREHRGGIDKKQASQLFACERLAARINELRTEGYVIDMERTPCINRFGENTWYGTYFLIKDKD